MKKQLILLYIFVLPYSGALSNVNLFGFPVFTWLNLTVFFVSILSLFDYKSRYYKIDLFAFMLLVSFFLTVIYSIICGFSITKTITNATIYYLPFFVYYLVKTSGVTVENVLRALFLGIGVAAVLSILIGLGIIDGGLRDKTYGASLNVFFVDGASGIFSVLMGVFFLNSQNGIKGNKLRGIICLIFGVIILLFYQSRGRILICIIMLSIMLLIVFGITRSRNKMAILFGSIVLVSIGIAVFNRNSTLMLYSDRIIRRFTTSSIEEDNISYRLREINTYWSLFCKNPIFGSGWGTLLNENVISSSLGTRYNAHNMYFGLLGVTGLSFTPLLIFRLLQMTFSEIHDIRNTKCITSVWCFCMLGCVLLLGIANAGFGKYFCIAFMIMIYTLHLSSNINPELDENKTNSIGGKYNG